MPVTFDPGPVQEPFATLVDEAPGAEVYPYGDFRVEWGPVFHRGRLDGTARVLVLGQDPAAHEAISRRILVGEAGQRVQGFLGKLGFTRSYVMVNTFLYSVYGQSGGTRHRDDPPLLAYRHRWLDALLAANPLSAVLALGGLAHRAWGQWVDHRGGVPAGVTYARITHPTWAESGGGGKPEAFATMLRNWNENGLARLRGHLPVTDVAPDPQDYGAAFAPGDLRPIPSFDLPAGLPPWMGGLESWANRSGATASEKRATVQVRVPAGFRLWEESP